MCKKWKVIGANGERKSKKPMLLACLDNNDDNDNDDDEVFLSNSNDLQAITWFQVTNKNNSL